MTQSEIRHEVAANRSESHLRTCAGRSPVTADALEWIPAFAGMTVQKLAQAPNLVAPAQAGAQRRRRPPVGVPKHRTALPIAPTPTLPRKQGRESAVNCWVSSPSSRRTSTGSPFSLAEQRKKDGGLAQARWRGLSECRFDGHKRIEKTEFRSQAVFLGVAVAGPPQAGNAPPLGGGREAAGGTELSRRAPREARRGCGGGFFGYFLVRARK